MTITHDAQAPQSARERTLTQLDHARLSRLLDSKRHAGETLADTLDLSDLVDPRDVPANVVTMNSRVVLAEEGRDHEQELTLCYPEQAEPAAGRVSVLSPVGSSLLGAQVGRTVEWTLPDGAPRRARVLSLAYQPEAAGDLLR